MRELAQELNVNDRALSTLQNRLRRLMRLPFIDAERGHNSVNRILDYVQNQGMHVVLEFGRYGRQPGGVHPGGQPADATHLRSVSAVDRRGGGRGRVADAAALVITIEEATNS